MADATRNVGLAELREIVRDPGELKKGTEIFDKEGLEHLARFGDRVFAEARGSGPSAYRVSVVVGATAADVKGRCSCMAARTRPFCKHAAALIVAWARAPESFASSDAPPPGAEPAERRKRKVRSGRVDKKELMSRGVEQVKTLVRELGVAGVASIAPDRPDQVRALAETLRENRLRRLSARTLELASQLEVAGRGGGLAPIRYADLLADLQLTARKLEKHSGGDPLEDEYVEELIGRTWRKSDRRPVADLDLVEYAYIGSTTPDGFAIRESRFLDLASGTHYSEKQILPGFLAKRTDPKPSHAGRRLRGASGSRYPGFAPHRLDLESAGSSEVLATDALELLLERALPDVSTLLEAFQEHRRDVFAPDRLPAAVRVSRIVAGGARPLAVDSAGIGLYLPLGLEPAEALGGVGLRAVLGDLDLDGVLPVLGPLAAVVEAGDGLELRGIGAALPRGEPRGWAEEARAAGVSAAALSVGEVREELATALVHGLTALAPRVTDPLAARLEDLGLGKQAARLRELVARPDAEDRLDDFLKLYQVMGLGVARLAGTARVDLERLVPVPGRPALFVPAPRETLDPSEVSRRRARGTLSRYEAAIHRARHFAAAPTGSLLEILPLWADGSCTAELAPAVARDAPGALCSAERALAGHHGLTAALTAVAVLAAVKSREAERLLKRAAGSYSSSAPASAWGWPAPGLTLQRAARRVLEPQGSKSWLKALWRPALDSAEIGSLLEALRQAPRQEARAEAAASLAREGDPRALPALRQAWRDDRSSRVRQAVARALVALGDGELVEEFVDALSRRAGEEDTAKTAAYALGHLGDVRGVAALIEAMESGWKPAVVLEALGYAGLVALAPLLDRVAAEPELARRRSFVSALESMRGEEVRAALEARLDGDSGREDFEVRAQAWLRLASSHAEAARAVAERLLARAPAEGREDESLRRAATRALKKATAAPRGR